MENSNDLPIKMSEQNYIASYTSTYYVSLIKLTQPVSGKFRLKKLKLNYLPWKTSEQNYIVSWTFQNM